MIRRTFIKALMASPLGFLIPKTRVKISGWVKSAQGAKHRRGTQYMKARCSDEDVRLQCEKSITYQGRLITMTKPWYMKQQCGGATLFPQWKRTCTLWNGGDIVDQWDEDVQFRR